MSGAAVTIVVMTMAAVNTLGIEVNFGTSFLMCVAVVCACGQVLQVFLMPIPLPVQSVFQTILQMATVLDFIIGVIQIQLKQL